MNIQNTVRVYRYFLAICYLVGFLLHLLDVLDLRITFSRAPDVWKVWIVYLLILDFIASLGLFLNRRWGYFTFLLVAFSQLIVYGFFKDTFGDQVFLIWFHIVTVAGYILTLILSRKAKAREVDAMELKL